MYLFWYLVQGKFSVNGSFIHNFIHKYFVMCVPRELYYKFLCGCLVEIEWWLLSSVLKVLMDKANWHSWVLMYLKAIFLPLAWWTPIYSSFKPNSLSPSLIFQMALSFVFPLYQSHSSVFFFIYLRVPAVSPFGPWTFWKGMNCFIRTYFPPSQAPTLLLFSTGPGIEATYLDWNRLHLIKSNTCIEDRAIQNIWGSQDCWLSP